MKATINGIEYETFERCKNAEELGYKSIGAMRRKFGADTEAMSVPTLEVHALVEKHLPALIESLKVLDKEEKAKK